MKKLGSILLILTLICTSMCFTRYTETSAATKKTGVKLSVKNCKINTTKVTVRNSASKIWDYYYDVDNGTKNASISVTNVKKDAYIAITANETGTLYVHMAKDAKNTKTSTIQGYIDKSLSKLAHGFMYSTKNKSYLTDFIMTFGDTEQYVMSTNDTLYLSIPENLKLCIDWLPTKTLGSIKEAHNSGIYYSFDNEVRITVSSEKFAVGEYTLESVNYFIDTDGKLSTGYKKIRDEFSKGNKGILKSAYVKDSPDSFYIKLGNTSYECEVPIEIIGSYITINSRDGSENHNLMVKRVSDIRSYDTDFLKDCQQDIEDPISCQSGTNIIIGRAFNTGGENICIQVGNKTYYTKTKSYTIKDKSYDGKGTISDIYYVVLSSNLKSGSKVYIWKSYDVLTKKEIIVK